MLKSSDPGYDFPQGKPVFLKVYDSIEIRGQEIGNRKQEAGGRKQEAGGRKQLAGSRSQETF